MSKIIPSFPDFILLSIELKDPYNKIIAGLPPYSDITFNTLQIWWNLSEELKVSSLNNNLVIKYHQPFDKINSGLSLVGKEKIDSSIITIFNYLESKNRAKRLVHVPEFVVRAIKNKSNFEITEELDYNEYILESNALAKLEGSKYQLIRKKIRRFNKSTLNNKLELKSLDLTLVEIQDLILKSIAEWEKNNKPNNDPLQDEKKALLKSIKKSGELGIKNLALYIDDKLHGIILYQQTIDNDYYILHHMKASYSTPYISDFMHHAIAKHAHENNIQKINIEMDLGLENLRRHKMTLRPSEFFQKYTVKALN